ncbi:hypothetical protein Trydic_g21618 [Trypoxylus dichotomus]
MQPELAQGTQSSVSGVGATCLRLNSNAMSHIKCRQISSSNMQLCCIKLHKAASETLQIIGAAYSDAAQVLRWYKAPKDGHETIEDDHRSGRPFTSKTDVSVAKVRSVLARDRWLTLRMIAHEVSIIKDTIHRIATKVLSMRKNCAKLVLNNLPDQQKKNRFSTSQQLFDRLTTEPTQSDNIRN